MASLYTHQDSNVRKTWLLMITFLLVVIGLGWALGWYFDNQLILVFAVVFALVMNAVSYWKSDSIVLAASGAKEADPNQYRELHRIVENLAITAGLPKPRVYVINDPAPNAFATGRDPKHSVIAVTTGLLSILDRPELEGVVAHEMSHIGNRDILVMSVVVVLVGFVALLSDMFLRWTFWGGGRSDSRGDGRVQIIMIIVGIALAILAPLIAQLIKLAISRKREFLADASGALLTRYPEGLASALEKIANSSHELRRANHATAHLYISNPFKGKHATSWFGRLFLTHPPAQERIRALRSS